MIICFSYANEQRYDCRPSGEGLPYDGMLASSAWLITCLGIACECLSEHFPRKHSRTRRSKLMRLSFLEISSPISFFGPSRTGNVMIRSPPRDPPSQEVDLAETRRFFGGDRDGSLAETILSFGAACDARPGPISGKGLGSNGVRECKLRPQVQYP
jgi:hypothetical protein